MVEGISTVETSVAVCPQCGGVKLNVVKSTKTAVIIECPECKLQFAVKCAVATCRVPKQEVDYAVKEKVYKPEPKKETPVMEGEGKPEESKKKPPLSAQGRRALRFSVEMGDQDKVIARAFLYHRLLNFADERFRGVQWMALSLEYMSAETLAGGDPKILEIIDLMDEAEGEVVERHSAKYPGKAVPQRKIRDARAAVMERELKRVGILKVEEYQGDHDAQLTIYQRLKEAEAKEREAADDDRIIDNGRFYRSMSEGVAIFVEENKVGNERLKFLVGLPEQYTQLLKKWKTDGGALLRLTGDNRTKDNTGRPPCCYIWGEDISVMPEFEVIYDDLMEEEIETPQLDIVQLVQSEEEGDFGYDTEEVEA